MKVSTVIQAASEVTGIPTRALAGQKPQPEYALFRRLCVYVCDVQLGLDLRDITKAFGWRQAYTATAASRRAMRVVLMNGGDNVFARITEQIRDRAENIEQAAHAAERRTA